MSRPGRRDLPPEEPQDLYTAPARAGDRYALVVGIDDYPVRPLQYAVQDAKAIAERLGEDFGFRVTCLIDDAATQEAIGSVLSGWRQGTRADDDVLVFFAGHGTHRLDQDGDPVGYLLPFGATDQISTWLVETDLIEQARKLPAQRVFLIFDACYAGAALREDVGIEAGERDDQVLKILVAGTEQEPVLDGGAGVHSIFTKALLDGLDGLADLDLRPDGTIAASELIAFVRSEVPWRSQARGQPQTPVGGSLHGAAWGGDFEFRPTRPRLSASVLRNLSSGRAEDRKAAMAQLARLGRTDRAALAADQLVSQLHPSLPSEEKPETAAERRKVVLETGQASAAALGSLGHPAGFAALTSVLRSHDSDALRASAATALGALAARPVPAAGYDIAGLSRSAIQDLIQALPDRGVRQAAMDGLSRLPAAASLLVEQLQRGDTGRQPRKVLLDTLAWVADRSPGDQRSWPALRSPSARLWRRYYLARRRIQPEWLDLVRSMVRVGLFGALGLALAYGVVLVAIHWGENALLYGSAALSVAAPWGLVAGATYAALPVLARCLARRGDGTAGRVGAIAAGLSLAAWMGIPNWFWGIGNGQGGCGGYAWMCRALPGLVVGPILGLALECLPWKVPTAARRAPAARRAAVHGLRLNLRWILLVAALTGVLVAALKIPPAFSFRAFEPHWFEVLWWGVGGALFGAAVAVGWCTSRIRAAERDSDS